MAYFEVASFCGSAKYYYWPISEPYNSYNHIFFWIPEKNPVVQDLLACHLLGECFLALDWELLQHSEKNKGKINLCHCTIGIKYLFMMLTCHLKGAQGGSHSKKTKKTKIKKTCFNHSMTKSNTPWMTFFILPLL